MTASRPADARAALVLAASAALALPALTAGPLQPTLDRPPAAALSLAVAALVLGAGWSLGRVMAAPRRVALGAAGVLLLVTAPATRLLPDLQTWVVASVVEGRLPYWPLLAAVAAVAALPVALPLGAALGVAVDGGGRPGLRAALGGAAVGLGLADPVRDVLLGAHQTVLLAAILAAAACLLVAERPGPTGRPARLGRGAAAALVAIGMAATLAHRGLLAATDLGSTTGCWTGAAFALGALVSEVAGLRQVALALVGLCVPVLLGMTPSALGAPPSAGARDLAVVLACGGLLGLGTHFARARDATPGPSAGWAPALVLAPAPLVLLVLGPRLGVAGTLLAALIPLGLAVLAARAWRRPLTLAAAAIGALLLVTLVDLRPAAGRATLEARFTPDADLGQVLDPLTGAPRLAVDGRADLGRHPLQERRFVHLPLLLLERIERCLLVAADRGEAAAAALEHHLPLVQWLAPPGAPVPDTTAWPFLEVLQGQERLFLAAPRPTYDALVLMPDPRVGRRAAHHASVEFYRDAARQVARQGLFCQWWDLGRLWVDDVKAALASARTAFPHVYVMVDHPRSRQGCLAVVGTHVPLRLDPARLDRRLSRRPRVGTELARVGLDGLLLGCLILQDEGLLDLLAPPEEVLHDARPRIAVTGRLRRLSSPETRATGWFAFTSRRVDPMTWLEVTPERRGDVRARVRDVLRGWQPLFDASRTLADGLPFESQRGGDLAPVEVQAFLTSLPSLPDWPHVTELLIAAATRLARDGDPEAAERLLRRAVLGAETGPDLRAALARLVEERGREQEAVLLYRTVLAFQPDHPGALAALERLEDPSAPPR